MSILLRGIGNGLWLLLSLRSALAFRHALRDVAGTQSRVLLRILRRNSDTEFGRRYGFRSIRSVVEYQDRVPLSTYDDYEDMMVRIREGRCNVLTRDPVQLLEPTSGSTAPTKLIPYTAELRAEFQRAIAPWIVDLYRHELRLLWGQAYWSLTPAGRQMEHTVGGIPVGFEDDSEYLGGIQRLLVRPTMAVPASVRLIEDTAAFRYVTLLFLLRSPALTLISVWNPTFLILLVERLPMWWPQLTDDIAHGTLSPPDPLPCGLSAELGGLNRPDPRRATEIQTVFESDRDQGKIHARLWPHLRVISCWTDSSAAMYLPQVVRLFPQARLQGKGLIATEGFVSFPLADRDGAVVAIRSHFFEFLPTDGGPTRLAHELELGRCYSLILTTGGGLYRYQLHDRVQVVGHMGDCPEIRFLGKEAHISDFFGEKVNEHHLQQVVTGLLSRLNLSPSFVMVACEAEDNRHAYTLFIESHGESEERLRTLGRELEASLEENYQYRYCRDLGQLEPLRVFRIERGALETYFARCQRHGQRAGDVKPLLLQRCNGWASVFEGKYLA